LQEVFLGKLSSEDVRECLRTNKTIIIPIGSTEQHGPHLPLTVDTDIAVEIALKVAEKIGCLVAPPLYYGHSTEHAGFPGSGWLQMETLGRVIEDVSVSYAEGGFKTIIWLNGHYGNDPALFVTCTDLTGTSKIPKDARVMALTYMYTLPDDILNEYLSWEKGWHAQEGETSVMLAIKPETVKMEKAPVEWPKFPRNNALMNAMFQGKGTVRRLMKTGIWGDARKATKEKGDKFLAEAVKSVAETIEQIDSIWSEVGHSDEAD
jgi:creatinine amidohydrolase